MLLNMSEFENLIALTISMIDLGNSIETPLIIVTISFCYKNIYLVIKSALKGEYTEMKRRRMAKDYREWNRGNKTE